MMNLLTFMLRSLKAERCDFGGGKIAPALEPFQSKDSTLVLLFKIAQKTAFEAKGRLYTTGKVFRNLLIIYLHT